MTTRPLGFSFLYFAPRIDEQHLPWFARAAQHGYQGVELPLNDATEQDLVVLRRALANEGLAATAVGFATAAANPIAAERSARAAAIEHLRSLIERAAAIGAKVLAGPVHSAYGVWSEAPPSNDERARCVEVMQAAGDHAARCGVTIALEPLNRFECYFLNTAADCHDLVLQIRHANVTGALDTHHAHIEEADTATAIAASTGTLGHVQLSENHRGTPGSGQVAFARVLAALDAANYPGWLVIEAFSRQDPAFGSLLRIWRQLDAGPDAVMAAGVRLVRERRGA